LLFACFPKLDLNFLVWVACLPLISAVVTERSLPRAFFFAYLAGVIFLGASCYWIIFVIEHYGGLSTVLAVGVLALLAGVFSIIFGAFGLVEAWIAARSRAWALALAPFLWVGLELARTYFLTGFPWNLLGYAVAPAGLSQLASVTAVYGLSFLAVATSALLVSALLAPRGVWSLSVPAAWLILLVATNWIYRPPTSPPEIQDAYLIQPNAPLDRSVLAWAPAHDVAPLERLANASVESACAPFSAAAGGPSMASAAPRTQVDCSAVRAGSLASRPLIVWAENPAPFYFTLDPVFRKYVERIALHTGGYVIFNTTTYAGPDNTLPHNSAIVLDPGGREVLQYDKIHLVPFGEYVPAWAFPGTIGKVLSEVSDYVPGSNYQTATTPDGAVVVSICYEDVFPQLVRRLTPRGPGVLVNITDDGWYGDSSARFQHLEIARFRALENGRYLLRATNDGITAEVDPYGRILGQLPMHRQMVLPAHFNYVGRQTFYNAHGDLFAWLCVAVTLGFVGLRIRERSKPL
ncbi:MAG TPA: apolipoprotein N-acyltransferase, partial [Terriglobia bacterium]|nr:apolipoprotein N-acyltransferase [Terriglobia bacterium]